MEIYLSLSNIAAFNSFGTISGSHKRCTFPRERKNRDLRACKLGGWLKCLFWKSWDCFPSWKYVTIPLRFENYLYSQRGYGNPTEKVKSGAMRGVVKPFMAWFPTVNIGCPQSFSSFAYTLYMHIGAGSRLAATIIYLITAPVSAGLIK